MSTLSRVGTARRPPGGTVWTIARTVGAVTTDHDMVDWGLAVATARRIAGSGPALSPEQTEQVVIQLRSHAARAEGFVAEHTGLVAGRATAPVVVVDRGGWAQANADAFKVLMTPVMGRLQQKKGGASPFDPVGRRLTGLELGVMLGFLASKVLGQYDPFLLPSEQAPDEQGRLLLVAPNIVEVERSLGVEPEDFRMWVCLHEETHRVQFGAVDWMRDHVRSEIDQVIEATPLDLGDLLGRLLEAVRGVADIARPGADGPSLLDLVQSPEQRAVVDRLAAVMSLLEGHADVVMDDVGPDVVPTVATIRRRFSARRDNAIGLSRVLRRLLGLEAKMRQYRDGAAFVRGVQDAVGIEGFNAVWTSPQMLPSPAEIGDPGAWVSRVHG
jgi:coenzyme F420 biosynthesis associated uncharacterized protein